MNKVVRNERRKHTASLLNTLAGGLLGGGAIGPLFAFIYGTSTTDWTLVFAASLICSLAALVLHLGGYNLLGGMEE